LPLYYLADAIITLADFMKGELQLEIQRSDDATARKRSRSRYNSGSRMEIA
jgi:hypothetical protein